MLIPVIKDPFFSDNSSYYFYDVDKDHVIRVDQQWNFQYVYPGGNMFMEEERIMSEADKYTMGKIMMLPYKEKSLSLAKLQVLVNVIKRNIKMQKILCR